MHAAKKKSAWIAALLTLLNPAVLLAAVAMSLQGHVDTTGLDAILDPIIQWLGQDRLMQLLRFSLLLAPLTYAWLVFALANGKGYSTWLCLLLIFMPGGVFIALLLKDKTRALTAPD